MSWIKLGLHPDDPKVAIVAMESGASKSEAYVAMLRWLFWLDENYNNKPISISGAMFKAATGWPNDKLASAFKNEDIGWVTVVGDKVSPVRPETYFSTSAKLRTADADKKKRKRKGTESPHQGGHEGDAAGDDAGTREEESREEEREETVAVAGGIGDEVQEKGATTTHGMTPAQCAVYTTLIARPVWLPSDREWIEPTTARALARRSTSTPAHAAYWLDKAKDRRREARDVNLAGFVIGKLEKPDMALVEALSAQEVQS